PTPHFDADRALATVRALATGIGPRLATGPAFRDAIGLLRPDLATSGYAVTQQWFHVPAGDSWGVPVEAGRSANVVATPPSFDPALPYAIVGAHLDTVAVAPGAEDNASGVAVVMELARTLDGGGLPVVLVLFGGEEPRGPGDLHHFGSKHYVEQMTREERRNLVAMVSLDRVGVGPTVPLYAIDGGPTDVRDQLERAGDQAGVPTVVGINSGSDHESFADAGLPAARLGGTSYAAYHSADDRPGVVDRAQLARVGRLLTTWITGRPPGR
ncbi:M28 family metallopeptidase, partial [Nocardioides sp.]|uniref:M28 family metallopeptidase n=1 Tax=Nocardioides sp. TaxID=35761 RepID=UPI002ED97B8C